jgi:hypothetical protein
MEYKKIGEVYYIRMGRDDEVIENILDVCRKESIPSAIYSGIGVIAVQLLRWLRRIRLRHRCASR